jgi:hypothetical protein
MSMNLCFDVVGGGHAEFPYQTSTKLTYAVLEAKTADERLQLILNDLISRDFDEYEVYGDLKQEVSILLNNPNLILTMI